MTASGAPRGNGRAGAALAALAVLAIATVWWATRASAPAPERPLSPTELGYVPPSMRLPSIGGEPDEPIGPVSAVVPPSMREVPTVDLALTGGWRPDFSAPEAAAPVESASSGWFGDLKSGDATASDGLTGASHLSARAGGDDTGAGLPAPSPFEVDVTAADRLAPKPDPYAGGPLPATVAEGHVDGERVGPDDVPPTTLETHVDGRQDAETLGIPPSVAELPPEPRDVSRAERPWESPVPAGPRDTRTAPVSSTSGG